jgi:bla regulator protein BlaR1
MAVMAVAVVASQTPAQKAAFEVASVKPANSGRPGMSSQTEVGRFKAINATASFLIQYAYGLKDFQLSGGPGWMGSDTFDIDAKGETKTGDREFPQMMRALLADRFQLKFHRATRTLPVFDLVVAKDGPKFTHAPETESGGTRRSAGQLTIAKGTVASLASTLSNILGRKVLDKTGLTGEYDMKLRWTPDAYQPPPLRPNGPPPDPNNPSIFTAVQEQLGLKLESSKGPVEILVIDSVSKPAEN